MADEIRCPFCGTTEFDEWSKGYIAHDSNVNCVMAGIAMWPEWWGQLGEAIAEKKNELKVFTNFHDWFVATDKCDLQAVYKEYYGETMDWMSMEENTVDQWEELPPHDVLMIFFELEDYDASANPPSAVVTEFPNQWAVKAPVGDWAKTNGRGFLCSIEW